MSETARRDVLMERAREGAEGTELMESPGRDAILEKQREEAQGVELFADPDATIPGTALKEGAPGHETLTGDSLDSAGDDDRHEVEPEEERF